MENWKIARDKVQSRMSQKIKKLHEMKIKHPTGAVRRASESGQTLVEVMVPMAVLGVPTVALSAAISSGFPHARGSREKLRAPHNPPHRHETPRFYEYGQVAHQPLSFPAP